MQVSSVYRSADPGNRTRNDLFGFDWVASAALNTYRDSLLPLTTAGTHEFSAFFSEENFLFLKSRLEKIVHQYTNIIDNDQLLEQMFEAYSSIKPRSDSTDVHRRTIFTPRVTQSYVNEMNKYILERFPTTLIQTNRQWDFYAKNMNGPSSLIALPIPDNRKGKSTTQAADYLLPN